MAPATTRPARPRATARLVAVLTIISAASVLAGSSSAQDAPSAGPAALPTTLTVTGHGWGHGRGMGQYGSLGYATGSAGAPWGHAAILQHFYGGTTVGHLTNPLLAVVLRSRA